MKRYVRTFFETVLESLSTVTGEWVPVGRRDFDIDGQINAFAAANPTIEIVDSKPTESFYPHAQNPDFRYRNLTYIVTYSADKPVVEHNSETSLPLKPG